MKTARLVGWPEFGVGGRLGFAALLVVTGLGTAATAKDDEIAPEVAVSEGPGQEIQVVGNVRPRTIEYDLGRMFDAGVFGPTAGQAVVMLRSGVQPVAQGERPDDTLARLEPVRREGAARIAAMAKVCGLGPDQRRTLTLALESDLRRIAGTIDRSRAAYSGVRLSATQRDPETRNTLARVQTEASACRQQLTRAFGPGSLLATVADDLLEPAQAEALAAWGESRRACRWGAMVAAVLVSLDETTLGLSSRQYAALEDLLLADVPALAVFPPPATRSNDAQFQLVLVLSRLGRLGPDSVRPLLDDRQWRELSQRIAQAGDAAAVEVMLVERGVLEKERP